MIDSLSAVSLIYMVVYSPFSIFLLKTCFLAVPSELEDAALIDGG